MFIQFLRSLNPDKHKELKSEKPWNVAMFFLSMCMLSGFLLGTIVSVQTYMSIIQGGASVDLTMSIDPAQPIDIFGMMLIGGEPGDSKIVVSGSSLYLRRFDPDLLNRTISRVEERQLGEEIAMFLSEPNPALMLMLLPSVIVIFAFLSMMRYLAIAAAAIIASLILRKRHGIVNIAIFSLSTLVLAEAIFKVLQIPFVPIALYLLFFAISLLFSHEKKLEYKEGKKHARKEEKVDFTPKGKLGDDMEVY